MMQEHPDWEAFNPSRELFLLRSHLAVPEPPSGPRLDRIRAVRIIRDYGVDWVTQDGDNMVKFCDSTSHTHAPGDSNYANSVDGVDEIIRAVQAQTPGVLWRTVKTEAVCRRFT